MNTILWLVAMLMLVSCDPPYVLIVENHSNHPIDFQVSTRAEISFDSIAYSDSLNADEAINLNTLPELFQEQMKIDQLDSVNYHFTLQQGHEVLIAPSVIGMPFDRVAYQIEGRSYEVIGEQVANNDHVEISCKPLRIIIVKIRN